MRVFTFTLAILGRFLADFFFGDDGDPDVVFVSSGLGGDNLRPSLFKGSISKRDGKPWSSMAGITQHGSILKLSSERLNVTPFSSQALFQPLPDVNVGPEIQLPLSSLGRVFAQNSARVSVFVSVVSVPLSGR